MTLGSDDLEKCKSDCKSIIKATQELLNAKNKQIQDENTTITDLRTSLGDTQHALDSSRSSLDAWYHNPAILIGLGVVLGGGTVMYLEKR